MDMTKVSFELEGLEELTRKLEGIADSDRTEKVALEKAADYLVQKAKIITPTLSTKLKESIVRGDVENGSVLIGPAKNVVDWRAHFVEFGTSKARAKPFMGPAFQSSKAEIQRILANELRRGMGL